MSDQKSLPFQSFAFTLIEDRRPRAAFRMTAADGGMYELHVEKGSAANPVSKFTRTVPLDVARRLKDALQDIGVFSWAEEYGNASGGVSRRWTVNTVFKEGVFSVASKGGSEVPPGFDAMLEELYRLDFPRPAGGSGVGHAASGSGSGAGAGGIGGSGVGAEGFGDFAGMLGASGMGGIGGLSAGDLGAYNAARGLSGSLDALGKFGGNVGGVDFSQLVDMMKNKGVDGLDSSEMGKLLGEAGSNPEAFQRRMREEFRHMSPEEQNRLLDALAATGAASRAWWERFLRG